MNPEDKNPGAGPGPEAPKTIEPTLHRVRVLSGPEEEFFSAFRYEGAERTFSFHPLIPMPQHLILGITPEVGALMFPYPVNLAENELHVDGTPVFNHHSWSGWCFKHWGSLSDARNPVFIRTSGLISGQVPGKADVDPLDPNPDMVLFWTAFGPAMRVIVTVARKFQSHDIFWSVEVAGEETQYLLKGGGVFDITNDGFLLHPDDGEEWDHQYAEWKTQEEESYER